MGKMNRAGAVPILMYHEITRADSTAETSYKNSVGPYFLREAAFRDQMATLKKNGFRTISLYQLTDYFNGSLAVSGSEKLVVITFDDGYIGNYLFALPILKEFGFTATIFVAAGLVGEQNMMSWKQLKEMADAGMSIQSHTLTHRFLKQLGEKEILHELSESKRLLESKLKINIDFISLPHGSYGKTFKELALRSGYIGGCSSRAGLNTPATQQFLFNRININKALSIDDFEKIIKADPFSINKLVFAKFVKQSVRSCIGEKTYKRVYDAIFQVNSLKKRKQK